jgi:hypothetical protein
VNAPIPATNQGSRPVGLWSLWDIMLKKAALEFGRALSDLRSLELACEYARRTAPQIRADTTGFLHNLIVDVLGNVRRACILGDLQEVMPELDRFQAVLNAPPEIDDVKGKAEHLRLRICDELKNEFYFQIDRKEVLFYGNKMLFGDAVGKIFKKALGPVLY